MRASRAETISFRDSPRPTELESMDDFFEHLEKVWTALSLALAIDILTLNQPLTPATNFKSHQEQLAGCRRGKRHIRLGDQHLADIHHDGGHQVTAMRGTSVRRQTCMNLLRPSTSEAWGVITRRLNVKTQLQLFIIGRVTISYPSLPMLCDEHCH